MFKITKLAAGLALVAATATHSDEPPVMATYLAGVGDYGHMTGCRTLSAKEARQFTRVQQKARPMPLTRPAAMWPAH